MEKDIEGAILPDTSIPDLLQKLDEVGGEIVVIVDKANQLIGVVTDGDVRRHILKTGGLGGTANDCLTRDPIFLEKGYRPEYAKKLLIDNKIAGIPVIDDKNIYIGMVRWNSIIDTVQSQDSLDIQVVIMAGGRGTRLSPFTHILPKPLIPIGEKPILRIIMDRFHSYGIDEFNLVVNYKGQMIKSYFEDTADIKYKINYFWEERFCGTGGGLRMLPEDFPETFIVSNCDILIDTNYVDLLRFHKEKGNHMTIVGSIQKYVIPYGVLKFSEHGRLQQLSEKPQYDLTVNTGVYVLEKSCLDLIPKDEFFHLTDLPEKITKTGHKVGVFPVSEKAYIDIGQWEEFRKNADLLSGSSGVQEKNI